MSARTPAGRLVEAFGNVEKMSADYADDIQWSLPASTPFERPMVGKDTVMEFNRKVWTVHDPNCQIEILDELGDDNASAVRFIYRTMVPAKGRLYENEYTVFARCKDGKLAEVHEAFDTVSTLNFFRDEQIVFKG